MLSFKRFSFSFLWKGHAYLFLIPLLASIIYFGVLAIDFYYSEAKFVLRSSSKTPAQGVLGGLLSSSGLTSSVEDAYIVKDYLYSRDALRELQQTIDLKAIFSQSQMDIFNQYPGIGGKDDFETLYKLYKRHLSVEIGGNASIVTLRLKTPDARASQEANRKLLLVSEQLVNKMSNRARQDLVTTALEDVKQLEHKVRMQASAISDYRNKRNLYDPEKQSVIQLNAVSRLQDELLAAKIQLQQVTTLSPANPQISSLKLRVSILEEEIMRERAKISGTERSLSSSQAEFDRLVMDKAITEKQLASAIVSLDNARTEAQKKTIYLERLVEPNLADAPESPQRIRSILASTLLCLLFWGIVMLIRSAVLEHKS
jgi:capsular polysaccharide transport system permease protein